MTEEPRATPLEELVRSRIGQEFDGEAHFSKAEAELIAAALSLRPAETRVKELEWRKLALPIHAIAARTSFGEYRIGLNDDGTFYYMLEGIPRSAGLQTLRLAKSAAQSDFEKRIKASISEPARAEEGKEPGRLEITEEAVEAAAKVIYDLDPFYEAGEYVEHIPVSPGGNLSWEQACRRDAEFASVHFMLPVTKTARDAARAALEASLPFLSQTGGEKRDA